MVLRVSGEAGAYQTYVRRRGRMTRAQARALGELAPRYCVPPGDDRLDIPALFGRGAPLGLEIGFGMGQSLVAWAAERPDWNLLGADVYQPGIGATLLGLEDEQLRNVRLVEGPAEQLLEVRLPPQILDEVRIFFPDPWPKKRHHKRRLVQGPFVALVASRMRPGGLLWLATDWEEYAEWMVAVLNDEPAFAAEGPPRITTRGEPVDGGVGGGRPATRFETRGLELGHRVWDLRYRKKRCSTESR